MSIITYAAKRNIEKNNFLATGADLSVSDTDNSINSTSTDLSGILAGEWIYVEGFTETDNNGWLQILSASTTNKIIIDSAFVLVTEAAGDSINIIGYKRGMGELYQLEFFNRNITPRVNHVKRESISIGGIRRSIIHRTDYMYNVSLLPNPNVLSDYYRQWMEFIYSVSASEVFQFDENGTIAVPITDFNCTMEGSPNINRIGINDFILSFNMVIQNAF
jgi:hypothetical protein